MPQRHYSQEGTFHVTTNTCGKVPWCTWKGVPETLIDNLIMTKNVQGAKLFAFCILPDHVHVILEPGKRGLSGFLQSWKQNSSRDVALLHGKPRSSDPRSSDPRSSDPRSSDSRVAATGKIFTGWQKGYFDERIRDAVQRSHALRYVTYNPVHHHFLEDIALWPWTSLHFPHLLDPMEVWLS